MSLRSPFPLSWPEGWARTKIRKNSDFSVPLHTAIAQVQKELRLLSASRVVITSNLPVSNKGIPYAAARADGGDPGVAVWWVQFRLGANREMVMACDSFRTAAENMRAIGKSLEALRGLKRWSTTSIADRAFEGFAALPPGTESSPSVSIRTWREVLGMAEGYDELAPEDVYAIARAKHAKLAREHHPDRGGDANKFMEANVALDDARKELGIE